MNPTFATVSGAIRRYDAAIADPDSIDAVEWMYIAMDLCDAADMLESAGGSVEWQRRIRDRANDCAVRGAS